MKNVHDLISDILRREGGYVKHIADRGGPTKFGITLKTYKDWMGRKVTAKDVKRMRKKEARAIYLKNYYQKPQICRLPDNIQGQVFDCAVNHGPRRAVKMLQKAINVTICCDRSLQLIIDGKIGPRTVLSCNKAQSGQEPYLGHALLIVRTKFYRRIVRKDPSQEVFLTGWLARANKFRV